MSTEREVHMKSFRPSAPNETGKTTDTGQTVREREREREATCYSDLSEEEGRVGPP